MRPIPSKYRRILTELLFLFSIIFSPIKAELSSSKVSSILPNKYVQSSPPCVAAVCKNGVALLALHSNIDPQLLPRVQNDNDNNNSNNNSDDNRNDSTDNNMGEREQEKEDDVLFPDLTLASRNPLRIERLDDKGSALLTCGWRTDGMSLADVGRDLCRDELVRYGRCESNINKNDSDSNSNDGYGKWLGWGLVKHLVKYEARDSVRILCFSFMILFHIQSLRKRGLMMILIYF